MGFHSDNVYRCTLGLNCIYLAYVFIYVRVLFNNVVIVYYHFKVWLFDLGLLDDPGKYVVVTGKRIKHSGNLDPYT